MKNIDILFILMPPSSKNIPSPSFSILKSYLEHHGFQSELLYGNFLYERDNVFFKEENTTETEALLPFLGLLDNLNPEKEEYINYYFRCFWPELFLADRSIFEEIKQDIFNKYLVFIKETIAYINNNNILNIGFTSKFHQWAPAALLSYHIKKVLPNVNIISGGWTNSEAAYNFMKLNSQFDFAIWGEGEIPLVELMKSIKRNDFKFEQIPRIIYRNGNNDILMKSGNGDLRTYVDFNSDYCIPNFDDYFKVYKDIIKQKEILLPIERGRGCNWNKCSFCYLSQGYKFRCKSTTLLIEEIKQLIKKYDTYNFFFTDNDVIGSDMVEFNYFLDQLIKLKQEYPLFTIKMAEVISKGVSFETIKKMSLAGFYSVQVGLESISDKLLKDINKKQNIIDNFFFIKSAINNNILIKGANIIIDTPNETDQMIMESINNLHSYRFLLSEEEFSFEIIPLGVANFSKYLKIIKNKNQELDWSISELQQLISERYTTDIDRFSLMDFVLNKAEKPLWNLFGRALRYYKRTKYSYTVKVNSDTLEVLYKEYRDNKLIKELFFDDKLYYLIVFELETCISNKTTLYSLINKKKDVDFNYFETCVQELIDQDLLIMDGDENLTSIIFISKNV